MKTKLLSLFLMVYSLNSFSWNASGHKLIASIAYNQLNDVQKNEVTELLKFHPEYGISWSKQYKKVSSVMKLGEFLMMRASVWPDEIRDNSNPNFKYHKPEWHYITYKIDFLNKHDTTLTKSEIESSLVGASTFVLHMFENKQIDNAQRAIYLAWFIHLIGDIHQPLHCGSLFNTNYPKGDRGGNLFFVKPNSSGVKLHTLWDGSLGTSSNDISIHNLAVKIRTDFSNLGSGGDLENYQPNKWSIESFEHVIKDVHLDGKLEGSTSKTNAPLLPENYTKNMKELAVKRSALAGFRLANTINKLKVSEFFFNHDDN